MPAPTETNRTRWNAGERVLVRATSCTVARVERFADCEGLRLAPSAPPDVPFAMLLVPFDRPRRLEAARQPSAMRPRRWLHAVRAIRAEHHPFGALRCAAGAKIDLLPYQLEPALAMLRHAHLRVLLADAVGLGKTIQAALVLAEVLDRDSSRRALVVMPAGLRHQWQSELAVHFNIEAAVCDAAWLRHRTRELPPDANPWALPGTYLVSLDFVKRPEVLRPLEELLWDLVIVDEAHAVTGGTDRRAAVDAVSARARRVLLLTGTPHSGDERQFDALCRIGEGPARTPLVMFRRTRSEVTSGLPRRSVLLRVRLSDAELRMHELLDRYTARVWRESRTRRDPFARLVALVLRKRALSSAGSLAASIARRIDLLSGADTHGTLQLPLPLYDSEDEVDDRVRDDVLGAPGLTDPVVERRWLGTLLEAARRAARGEHKMARLRRLLTRVSEPAIVFTEYRDTLSRLQRALEGCRPPLLTLHGGMSAAERRAVQRAFNDTPSLLLATDAAAEGLNLQRRCRLVIHYELPWNPLRLEQRTGRVDRIGQQRRVHEIALVADATAERMVLAPLARRAARAKELASSGGRMLELLSESRVADAIITDRGDALLDVVPVRIPCPEPQLGPEAIHEAARLADERGTVRPEHRARSSGGTAVTTLDVVRRGDESSITLLYTLSLGTPDGRVVHAEPMVLRLETAAMWPVRSTADAIRAVEQVVRLFQPRIDPLLNAHRSAVVGDILPMYREVTAALRAREIAIAQIRQSAARQLVQAGLFDRRALRDAERQAAIGRDRDAQAEGTLAELAETLVEAVTLDAVLLRVERRR